MLLGSGPEPTRADLRRNKVCEYFLTSQHSSNRKNQTNSYKYNENYISKAESFMYISMLIPVHRIHLAEGKEIE